MPATKWKGRTYQESVVLTGGIVVPPHDAEVITYDGSSNPTSITCKVDDPTVGVGENGRTVAVVSITYSGSNPTIIKRTA